MWPNMHLCTWHRPSKKVFLPLFGMGTINKFTSKEVSKQWKHITAKAETQGITVVSFGADGDSHELKSMKFSTFVFTNPNIISVPFLQLEKAPNPSRVVVMVCSEKGNCHSVYTRHSVHIAVTLKSRLIKPPIVLPLGKCLAGVHHLHLVRRNFGKDQDGLRERDINHKYRQNYDVVLHKISEYCSPKSLMQRVQVHSLCH